MTERGVWPQGTDTVEETRPGWWLVWDGAVEHAFLRTFPATCRERYEDPLVFPKVSITRVRFRAPWPECGVLDLVHLVRDRAARRYGAADSYLTACIAAALDFFQMDAAEREAEWALGQLSRR